MKNFNYSSNLGIFTFSLFFSSLLLGFYLNEDLLSRGTYNDFHNTWGLVLALKEDLLADYTQWAGHTPLHYIIMSRLYILINDKYLLRLFFCFLSILVPLLFYLNLKIKFDFINRNTLLILASLIFILPTFRSCAIWANYHVTALIFFLLSNLFFLKWNKKENYKKIDSNIILHLIFLSLAVYCIQYYALLFLYFMIIYFQKLEIKAFLLVSIMVFIFSLPGFLLIFYHPWVATITFSSKLYNSLLINASIMSFYLIPIFFFVAFNNNKFFAAKKNYLVIPTFFSILMVCLLSIWFDYNYQIGGGFLLKLSFLLFNNKLLFYSSAIFGFTLLTYLSIENRNNCLLILIMLFGFSAWFIFQKYLEPLFLIVFFLIFNSEIPKEFLKNYKNLLYLFIYVCLYFISAITNDIFKLIENI